MEGKGIPNLMPLRLKALLYLYMILDFGAFVLLLIFYEAKSVTCSANIVFALNGVYLLSVGFSDLEW